MQSRAARPPAPHAVEAAPGRAHLLRVRARGRVRVRVRIRVRVRVRVRANTTCSRPLARSKVALGFPVGRRDHGLEVLLEVVVHLVVHLLEGGQLRLGEDVGLVRLGRVPG